MRGFLGGVSVGALLAAGGLAMLSLSVPLPVTLPGTGSGTAAVPQSAEQPAVAAPAPAAHDPGDAPQMPNDGSKAAEAPASSQGRDADLVEAQPAAPAETGGGDDLNALAGADTAPAAKPEVGLTTAVAGSGGLDTSEAPGVTPQTDAPQLQAVQPPVPQAPGAEAAVIAATEPAPEPAPEAPAEAQEEASAPVQAEAEAGTPGTSAVLAPDIGSAPQATTLPVIGAAPVLPEAGEDGGGSRSDSETELETAAADQELLTPSIGTPVVPLTDRDKPQEAGFASAAVSDEPPFTAHSEAFDNPENRPLMSIVLIDEEGAFGAEALAEFPYPLSFAIDPEDPQAASKMAARRAAGFEVLMLADLPRAASPQDAETALEIWRSKLPEAMGILEGIETGVQGNRALANQVAAVAASAGYGLVTQDSGLNTVQKLALRDGVPAGVVFRDFDGAGQNPRAIRRFLDQAAFRAGQEGAVIMLGRLRPDTISALLIWGLQDRAARIALAPVSASLEENLPAK
ncbi:polysaccharide deacteylase family 2 protein [Leisingera methylohalidivorans]|uniref:Polysaccharide deacetylase n=1 Tax=Leisingera methylohalidivorans DSM 14336 TaxID=999552 RepID=V9VU08_9RHOB|nr:polysaccharide deacteylase family 2 protein [Leisingera methylohalidivorans]AHD00780.1 polysaccharide deacetylase [Leisingera methylohalidivorans DSM 14336]